MDVIDFEDEKIDAEILDSMVIYYLILHLIGCQLRALYICNGIM